MYNYQDDEQEINLVGLMIYVCKQWKKLIILLIVGAVLGCGVSFYKLQTLKPENVGNYLDSLKEEDIDKDNIKVYADYKTLYDESLELGEKSIVLNMDQNNVYSASLKYFIKCDYEEIDGVVAYFNSLLDQGSNFDNLIKASGLSCTKNDIQDLVSVSCYKIGLDNQIISGSSPLEERNANLSFSVSAPSEKSLNGILSELENIVDDAQKEIKGLNSQIAITELSVSTSYGYSSGVANAQKTYLKDRQNLLKEMTTLSNSMSDNEKLYYSYNFDKETFDEKYEMHFSKKWPVIVGVVVALVGAICYAVGYIFDKHIKSENELAQSYGLYVLGSIDNTEGLKGLDKTFDRWDKASLAKANDAEYLSSVIASVDANSIALIYNDEDEQSKALADTLLKADNRLKNAGNTGLDKKSTEVLMASENSIIIVHNNVTTKAEFEKYLDSIDRLEKDLAGAIVIR